MDSKISKLLNIVSASEISTLKTDVNEYANNLFDSHNLLGALFCSYESFKSIAQFEVRNCIINRTTKYILYLEMQCADNILPNAMTKLLNIADGMLRINDVYTRISLSQMAIMINLNEESQAYIVIERILSRFFKKHSRYDYRISYNVQNIINSSFIQEHLESNNKTK